jgi:hypothetical protein
MLRREGHRVVMMVRLGKAEVDKHFLRGLLWCGPSNDLMIPAVNECGRRFYGCPHRKCPRPLVPAEEVEQLVWARYAALNEAVAKTVSRSGRHEALVAVLSKVTVGVEWIDLDYCWLD